MEKILRKPLPMTVEKKDRVLDKYDRKELHILFSIYDTPHRFRNEAFRVAEKQGQEAAKRYIRAVSEFGKFQAWSENMSREEIRNGYEESDYCE